MWPFLFDSEVDRLLHHTLGRQELPVLVLMGVSVDERVGEHPSRQNFFSLLRPERLLAPPLKHWKIRFLQVATLTGRSHIPTSKVRPSLTLGDDVVNRHLAVPLAAVSACRLLQRTSQWVVGIY